MPNFVRVRFRTAWILSGLMSLILTSPLNAQKKETPAREQIGEVLGKPVYRDEITTGTKMELHNKLQWLFYIPVIEKYFKKHKSKFELTKKEIASVIAFHSEDKVIGREIRQEESLYRKQLKKIDNQLEQPGLTSKEKRRFEQKRLKIQSEHKQDSLQGFVIMLAEDEKFERHLYKNYGGGRIRSMMMGAVAFDATHKWLEDQEKKGHFKITDPKLRTAFYQHWTDTVNISYIESDKEDIRAWLREPEWASKSESKK